MKKQTRLPSCIVISDFTFMMLLELIFCNVVVATLEIIKNPFNSHTVDT